ncbi:MAG: hypothetical protein KF716_12230 [Anaerolineae bacterium]|nr:hypothetical protein [Anaerolineae bacterium]
MTKKTLFYAASLAIIAILIVGINSVYAQGPNNGSTATGTPTPYDCGGMMQGGFQRGWGRMGNGSQDCGPMGWMSGGGMMRRGRGAGMYGGGMWTGMNGANMDFAAILPPASAEKPSQAIVDLMIAGWKDEQQAYATYQAAIDKFGQVFPLVNIQRAEAQHIAAWEFLFQRYGIALPEKPTASSLDATTLQQACKAAADLETANFQLYDKMLTSFTAYPDLTFVATMLRNASEFHHLPALQNCAG